MLLNHIPAKILLVTVSSKNTHTHTHTVCFSGTTEESDPFLLLILKWGGELTPAGRIQAEELGRDFRCMYPGGHGKFPIFSVH